MIQFKVIPSCFRVFVSGLMLETIAGTPVLGVTRLPLDGTLNVIAKRVLDIVGALDRADIERSHRRVLQRHRLAGITLGAVFYRQRRWGFNGVPFDIIKIRSMKLNAEQATGATVVRQR
jgi:lipopolysaccharide/colanic/teichoic acid biosynthesis glycosyltransferase